MKRLSFLLLFCTFVNAEQIEYLTPPMINSDTIHSQVSCTRPMRHGKFNISREQQCDKTVIHCYGQGGSGYTTLFGSVQKAIELLGPDAKQKPIRIIGSGCIGLTVACELERAGYTVAGISTKQVYDITSWTAGGYFAYVSMNTSKSEQKNLDDIGNRSLNVFHQINSGEHPYLRENSVRFVPTYCRAEADSGLDKLVAQGVLPEPVDVTIDFGNGVRHPNYRKYMTYFIDTTNIMLQLHQEVERLGIPIQFEEVSAFDELKEEIIFNCTGIGAKELNEDQNLIAVRGHLIYLNERSGLEHMNYIIFTEVEQDGKAEPVYMFPKCLSVTSEYPSGQPIYSCLGCTFIPNTDRLSQKELEELDRIEFKRLLDRNCQFFLGRSY